MSKTWLPVADAAKARRFGMRFDGMARRAHTFPTALLPPMPGMLPRGVSVGVGTARDRGQASALPGHTSLREKSALQFADLLRDAIRQGRLENQHDQRVLTAPPRFPGVRRDRLDGQTPKCVTAEAGSDLLARSPTELHAYLPT